LGSAFYDKTRRSEFDPLPRAYSNAEASRNRNYGPPDPRKKRQK
jgi:hypothetical protein